MGYGIEGIRELSGMADVAAPVHVHRDEAEWVKRSTGVSDSDLVLHESGDTVSVGAIDITMLHTPGHTPGSQCFLVDGCLVAGDTLFLEGCGRTDLPGADPDQMYVSLTQRLAKVPDDTVLYPGHMYSPRGIGHHGRDAVEQLRLPDQQPRPVAPHDGCRVLSSVDGRLVARVRG